MAQNRATTIADYIRDAPEEGQPHLQQLYALLKSVAPEAKEVIKWGNPFFVEPRFLFAFTAHKAHLSFAPVASAMDVFHEELAEQPHTKGTIKVPYNQPLPEELIRKIAEYCLQSVREREDGSFW